MPFSVFSLPLSRIIAQQADSQRGRVAQGELARGRGWQVSEVSGQTVRIKPTPLMPSKKKNNRNSIGKSPKAEDDEDEVPKKVAVKGWWTARVVYHGADICDEGEKLADQERISNKLGSICAISFPHFLILWNWEPLTLLNSTFEIWSNLSLQTIVMMTMMHKKKKSSQNLLEIWGTQCSGEYQRRDLLLSKTKW
jgi:hypothetical protein